MNDFWISYVAGMVGLTVSYMILMFVLIYVVRWWQERKAKKWNPIAYIDTISESNKLKPITVEDFDIDYNTYATHRDPELQALIEKMPRPASFISLDEEIEQRDRHATDTVLSLAEELDLYHVDPARARHLSVVPDLDKQPRPDTMLDLAGEVPYCGVFNNDPEAPHWCTRDAGHDKSPFGPVRKHGYRGMTWD